PGKGDPFGPFPLPLPPVLLDWPSRSEPCHERAYRLARMIAWSDPDAQIPGVDPSRSLDGKRFGDQALHLVGDGLRVRIRGVERELDLVVVLQTRRPALPNSS